jgi:hypothetical protein
LHRGSVCAHERVADYSWISRRTGEAVVSFAKHDSAVPVGINDSTDFATSAGPAAIARAIFVCTVSPEFIAEMCSSVWA